MSAACDVSVIAELTGLGKEISFVEKFATTVPTLAIYNYESIATGTEVALKLGDVVTVEFVIIKNTDATNYIEIDCNYTAATFRANIHLAKGDTAMFKPSGSVYALANAAAATAEYLIVGTT